MSVRKRLKRVVKSWTGVLSRDEIYYSYDDARMILTDLGMQMSPEALAYLTSSEEIMEEFLGQVSAVEKKLGLNIIKDQYSIDPELQPKVYEIEGEIIITILHKGVESILVEFPFEEKE